MKLIYFDKPSRAILDCCSYPARGDHARVITRINVPVASRGKGLGSKLLDEVCRDADAEGVTLYLEVLPSGGLTLRQLTTWYERNGFSKTGTGRVYRRPPRV